VLRNLDKRSLHILPQLIFLKNRYSKKEIKLDTEFAIITVMTHKIMDLWKVTYYFPKSKRRLTNYLNLVTLQDMPYKDIDIFELLEYQSGFKSFASLEIFCKRLSRGQVFLRKRTTID
jgi:hypothetical protein